VTRQLYLQLLTVAIVCIVAACNNNCNPGGGGCTTADVSDCGGGDFVGDTLWKTDIPKELADSSASATVTAVFGFASTPTSADSAEITSTGGSIINGVVIRGNNSIAATYPAAKLITLAETYTGSDILSVTIPTGGSSTQPGGSGCTPTG
jgi:hypothetical protein